MIRPILTYRLAGKEMSSALANRSDMGEVRDCAAIARERGAEDVRLVFLNDEHREVASYGV